MNVMTERFCTHCGCHVMLHDDNGCACENNEGHTNTLKMVDSEEYCECERTQDEFFKYSGWSTNSRVMMNGSKAHA